MKIKIKYLYLVLLAGYMSLITMFAGFSNSESAIILSPIVLPSLIFLPGALSLKLINKSEISFLKFILYSIGISISVLMFGGFLINGLLPMAGFSQPLSRVPLSTAYGLMQLFLLIIFYSKYRGKIYELKFEKHSIASKFIFILSILILFLSIAGAIILNNFGSGYTTIFMTFLISFTVIFLIIFKDKVNKSIYPFTIYFIGLSLLFMYSLRSEHVIGWDIHQEFMVLQATYSNLRWDMSYFPQEAYNACLSITILPTILSEFLHTSLEYTFKVIYPIIFAFLPVVIYSIASKYLNRWKAFLATFFFMSQVWFYEQMPALARQEIGFIFYSLIILVLLDKEISHRLRIGLFYLFSASLIVSHYSTAYIWIVQLGLATAISYFFVLFRRKNFKLFSIRPSMIVFSIIMLLVWEVMITHSYGSSYKTLGDTKSHLLESFLPSKLENSLVTALYGTPNVNTTKNILIKYHEAGDRSTSNNLDLYSASQYSDYAPVSIDDRKIIPSKVPSYLSKLILIVSKISKALTSYLFLFSGFLFLFILQIRKKTLGHTDQVLMVISGFGLVILILLLPNLQANYNFSRLYMQALILACILPIVSAGIFLKITGKYQSIILGILLVMSFIFSIGVVEQFTGGVARITLDQPNGNFDTFYVYNEEVESAKWLSENMDTRYHVFADVLAGMRLSSYGDMASNPDVFPNSISKDGYVYLSVSNVKREHGFAKFDNNTIVFNYPVKFLNREKNLIYNNGGSRIYK